METKTDFIYQQAQYHKRMGELLPHHDGTKCAPRTVRLHLGEERVMPARVVQEFGG